MDPKNSKLTRSDYYQLFSTAAFFVHAWTIYLALQDISWIAERTNMSDALGVFSYGLVFAFIESLVYFAFVMLLGLLVPKGFSRQRKLAVLAVAVFLTSLGGIFGQLYFLLHMNLPQSLIQAAAQSAHPIRYAVIVILAVIVPIVAAPFYLTLRSEKFVAGIANFLERLAVLSTLYFVLDLLGLINILIRNIGG